MLSGQPKPIGLGFSLAWGSAALGTALFTGVAGALLPIFYQDYLGLGASWIALASGIFAIWNAMNDPLFGYISDNTKSRWGRRIPYMRFVTPLLGLFFVLLWLAPAEGGPTTQFAWMLISLLLFDSAYTVVALAYNSLLPEIVEDDAGRNRLQIAAALFGLVGLALGFVIPDLFRPKPGSPHSIETLQVAMLGVALVGMLFILVTSMRIKERPEFVCDKPLPLRQAIRFTFTSRPFLVAAAQNFMVVLTTALVVGSIFYLADYVLHIRGFLLLGCFILPLLIGIPVTSLLRGRLGVAGAMQLMLVVAGVGLLLVTVLPAAWIPLGLALAGFGLAGPQTLTNLLFAQVADDDELRSGVRREGAFFGVNALITKPAQSVALALSPWILYLTHFVARGHNAGHAIVQPESALLGIRLMTGAIPGVALLLAALILALYPLRGERLREMQSDLLALHEKKKKLLCEE